MRARLFFFVVVLCVIAPGCRTTYPEGVYECTAATEATLCPPGWYCHADLRCWSRIETSDAATPDAFVPSDARLDAPVVLPDGCVVATYYLDADGDRYGLTSIPMQSCSPPLGYAEVGGDCDDGNAAVHPGMSETCNGLDDDCSGVADDGGTMECVRGLTTSCTTACGSTSTGLCSATCMRPVGASCAPPTAETLCDGLDDNCNGVADEGLGSIGEPVTAIANGGTPHTQYPTAQLVPSDTGFVMFSANLEVPARVLMQALSTAGAPMGAPIPLDARIAPALVPLSVLRVVGGYVLAYGSWSSSPGPTGPITLAFLDDVGAVLSFGTLAPPSGYGAWQRVVLRASSSIASRLSVYASMRTTESTPTLAIRRYSVDYASATPIILSETNVAADLSGDLFDVAIGAPDEWIPTAQRATTYVSFDSIPRPRPSGRWCMWRLLGSGWPWLRKHR